MDLWKQPTDVPRYPGISEPLDTAAAQPTERPPLTRPRNSLHQLLMPLWRNRLGVAHIDIDKPFCELCTDFNVCEQLIGDVERTFHQRIARPVNPEGLTIELLAEMLLRQRPAARVLEIQEDATGLRVPLFFFHGDFNGGGFYTHILSAMLGSEQPFYSIQPLGFDGQAVPSSIEEMADIHTNEVLSRWSRGPFLLGGLCNGGLVAFEIATRLIKAGHEVPFLLAIDSIFGAKTANWKVPEIRRSSDPSVDNPLARSLWQFSQYMQPVWQYVPPHYPGKLTLFWSRESTVERDPASWTRAADVTMCSIPGDHITCIGTHVGALGRMLKKCLDEVLPRFTSPAGAESVKPRRPVPDRSVK